MLVINKWLPFSPCLRLPVGKDRQLSSCQRCSQFKTEQERGKTLRAQSAGWVCQALTAISAAVE